MTWEDDAPQSEVTIKDLEDLSDKIANQRSTCDEISRVKKEADAALLHLENRMLALLNQAGKTNYRSNVGLISITTRETVRIPQDLDAKREFFKFLQERGIFDEVVGVHSQTLNSLYKSEKAAAEERGEYAFKLPGIGEPSRTEIVTFRRNK